MVRDCAGVFLRDHHWKRLHDYWQNWTNILWASRTTASNTAAYCTEFTTVIMPFVANLTTPVPASLSVEVLSQYSDVRYSVLST
jgi:hypothetical protein